MSKRMIAFWVPGIAKSKGSLVSGIRKDGKRFNRTQNSHGQAEWAARVAVEAKLALARAGYLPLPPLIASGVTARITFVSERPKSHFTAKGMLKLQVANELPARRPDADKLCRSVGDALTGVVFKDDAQMTTVILRKRWGKVAGAYIEIGLDDSDADFEVPNVR